MKSNLKDNLSYKFVALGVALILWMSMLLRKDATVVKDFELQYTLPPAYELNLEAPSSVRVEVAGRYSALKIVDQMRPILNVDLTLAHEGRQEVRLSPMDLSLPRGARVVLMEPSAFIVELRRRGAPPAGVK